MQYKANNYAHLFGMSGFSTELLKNHFVFYQSYVEHATALP